MSMKKTNVLIFPAGAENALEIHEALKYNLHFTLFGASGKQDYGELQYPPERYHQGDLYIGDPGFLSRFNRVLDEFQIDLIVPTHDTIALYLAQNAHLLHGRLVCSNARAAYFARNKLEMFSELQGEPFLPRVYQAPYDGLDFPLFVKPSVGEGAKGAHRIDTMEQFEAEKDGLDGMVVCEYLPGREYTVDCFTDRHGTLLFAGARSRERIGMGIAFRCCGGPASEEIREIAQRVGDRFGLRGAWYLQLKEDREKRLKLMEFSVRMAGTMVYFRQLGVNFPALSLFDAMGLDVSILFNDYPLRIERCIKTRCRPGFEFQTLYVDLDDTLIVDGQVNSTLVQLIYQCVNTGKKVVLLTKHEQDLDDSLARHRLSRGLFDEVILLAPEQSKADYIRGPQAVLIDNYFQERRSVRERLHIPVFDVDAAECLLREDIL